MSARAAALFDLDGTLLDTPAGIVATFSAVFEAMGVPAADPVEVRGTIGLPLQVAFGKLLGVPADDPVIAEAVAHYQRCFREVVLPIAPELVFDGVRDGLARLRAAGLALAVATSKFHASADTLLTAAGIRDEFEIVLGADEVGNPKPHPEMALALLDRLAVPAGRTVMVGDTSHDLLMARSAGLRSIAVTYGVHPRAELAAAEPTWIVDHFSDAADLLRHALTTNTEMETDPSSHD
ncbi:MAG TPA: HAD family hydrolase [Jatrophihabitans sp.]|nr:HAD family hydrolase [Jatrophihabitans sp.]